MGDSDKLDNALYNFDTHRKYLDGWFEALELTKNVTLVLHDWGSALGFCRAYTYPEQIKAIAYMEAFVMPRLWSDFPDGRDIPFRALRSEKCETMVMDNNFFIETILPKSILRELTEEEMDHYRQPFLKKE